MATKMAWASSDTLQEMFMRDVIRKARWMDWADSHTLRAPPSRDTLKTVGRKTPICYCILYFDLRLHLRQLFTYFCRSFILTGLFNLSIHLINVCM